MPQAVPISAGWRNTPSLLNDRLREADQISADLVLRDASPGATSECQRLLAVIPPGQLAEYPTWNIGWHETDSDIPVRPPAFPPELRQLDAEIPQPPAQAMASLSDAIRWGRSLPHWGDRPTIRICCAPGGYTTLFDLHIHRVVRSTVETESLRQLQQLGIAATLYRLQTGRLPATLARHYLYSAVAARTCMEWCACVHQARTATYSNLSIFLKANPRFPMEIREVGLQVVRACAQKAHHRQ